MYKKREKVENCRKSVKKSVKDYEKVENCRKREW